MAAALSPASSEATEFDPLAPDLPAAQALLILRPENAAAKLAFSEVVDFIQDQKRTQGEGDDPAHVVSHYARFIWFFDGQVSDAAVTRLVRHKQQADLPGSSSPLSSSSDNTSHSITIWKGFFFIDVTIAPLLPAFGWSVGRLSRRAMALGQPLVDLLLTTDRKSQVSRRHARIQFSNETRLACVVLDSGSSATVGDHHLAAYGDSVACTRESTRLSFEDLQYTLEYTAHCQRPEGRENLQQYLTTVFGREHQPSREALIATPTPSVNALTLGQYTFTAAGLIGAGSYGSVKPATGPQGDKVVAIKTMMAKHNNTQSVRSKIETMEALADLVNSERQTNLLKIVEYIYVPGSKIDEFHVVLEPYAETTADRLPSPMDRTKYELIIRDCLRGLTFLHSHGYVHTDIKPANIGLVNFYHDQAGIEEPSTPPLPPRTLYAVLLDIDSVEQVPANKKIIPARPGMNGTIAFLSPEHELSGYDGTTDVWALSVSLYKMLSGTLPWPPDKRGNPWREDAPNQGELLARFHSRYEAALAEVTRSKAVIGDALFTFLFTAFRFSNSEIASQQSPRPTSLECLRALIDMSPFLKARTAVEQQNSTVAGSKYDVTNPRSAPEA